MRNYTRNNITKNESLSNCRSLQRNLSVVEFRCQSVSYSKKFKIKIFDFLLDVAIVNRLPI